MQSAENTPEKGEIEHPSWDSIVRAEEELLSRARNVAQQITERVRQLLGNHGSEPASPDGQAPQST